MKLTTLAFVGAFVGCLGAQQTTQTETTRTTTTTSTVNMNGTLVDQGCYTTHTQSKETNSVTNTTTETSKLVTECPVTESTTSFGMITPQGKFVRFDDSGNTRVVEMVKSNKEWHDYISGHKPVRVRVVGTPNGDVVVIKEIK